MDSIEDIKEEIIRLSEAIASLATQNTDDESLRKELKNLSNDLNERVHLLGFAYHIFEETETVLEEKEDIEAIKTPVEAPIEQTEAEESVPEPIVEEQPLEEEPEQTPTSEIEETPQVEEEVEEEPDVEEEKPAAEAEAPIKTLEISEESLNDKISKLSQADSLANKLQNQPIKNLKTAIGLNERFLFANELFGGDGTEYNRAIEEFNHLESLDAALRLIEHKYQPQYNWDFDDRTVQNFLIYLKRRFSFRESA